MSTRRNRWFSSRTSRPQTQRARPLVELLEDRLAPAVLTVNTLDDNVNQDGVLSLREAIGLINRGHLFGLDRGLTSQETAQVNATDPFGSNDTIRFAPLLNRGTITLTGGGRLALNRAMQIVGPTLGVTLSGAGVSGILHVDNAWVDLTNLTLRDGNSGSGGAILNEGILTITACRFTNNQATDGGAIDNFDTVRVVSSTFDNNRAVGSTAGLGRGGAISNSGDLFVTNCTFVDNSATDDGGAIFTFKQGTDTILSNSIVAGNFKGTTPNDLGTPLVSKNVNGGFNLIGDADTAGGLSHDSNGNIVGNNGSGTRPTSDLFFAPANRVHFFETGAPTLTYLMLASGFSLVVDKGDNALADGIARDQRGLPRLSGSKVDIGALERTQQAGPYAVNVSHDEVNPGDGQLSLREALLLANDDPGVDSITFAASVPVVVLTNGTLRVRDSVTITGTGVRVERSAAPDVPDFGIFTIEATLVTLDGLTIANGRAEDGGGIFVDPDVIERPGIDLTIRNCQIVGNAVSSLGGGIFIEREINKPFDMAIIDSTIAANTAIDGAGGIYSFGAFLTLSNSTVSGNLAPVGGGFWGDDLTAINATIAYNQGTGIVAQGSLLLHNTIVAGNLGQDGFPLDLFGSNLDPSSSYNLIGKANTLSPNTSNGLVDGTNGNKVGVNVADVLNPVLANNGGLTHTHSLVASTDNPARDAGSNARASSLTTDQRGLKRIRGANVDIGAYELLDTPITDTTLVVTEAGDVVDGDFSSGRLSLREAILLANDSFSFTVNIRFDGVAVVTLTAGELNVTRSGLLNIDGEGVRIERSTAPGTPDFRIFAIGSSADVSLRGLTLSSGAGASGGAVFNSGELFLADCTIAFNTASQDGGGIFNEGDLTLVRSTINNNSANGFGGGIANLHLGTSLEPLRIESSTLSSNQAGTLGGGLYNASEAILVNATVVLNTAAVVTFGPSGGGIYTTLGDRTRLSNTIVAGNTIPGDGSVGNDLGGDDSSYNNSNNKNNLIGDPGSDGGLINGVNGNVVGVALSNVLDATLRDNGGRTFTHALSSGSPALDRGNNASLTGGNFSTDQRGQPRITNGTVDIGAFEVNPTLLLVDNAGDGVDGNFGPGQLTLREAVQLANTRAGEDTILFASHITTVTLTQGELVLTDSARTTIRGATIQRDTSAPSFRIFRIDLNAAAFFLDLTIANGAAFEANNDKGGGILNNGTLDLYFCTLRNNSAADGGNLANGFGTLLVVNSTLAGGIANRGAGFWNLAGTPQFLNTTISGNRATSGGSGGGIFQVTDAGSVHLINTLVAGNFVGSGTTPDDINGPMRTISNNNLIGVNTGMVGISNGSNGNQVGTSASPLNPRLGPLRNNGGLTPTFALLPGSPALNAGSNFEAAVLNTDQRGAGFPRLVQGTVDIGAFEANIPTDNPIVVDSLSDGADGDFGPGQLSLREAILLANDRAGADTITFAPTLDGQTIAVTGGELRITGPLTITGLGARNLTLNGNNQNRIFNIDDGSDGTFQTVIITDLRLIRGRASSGNGGAILNKENLTLTNVALTINTASGVGGAIAHDRGSLTVTGSTFAANTSGSRGGAIDANAGTSVQISNSTISGNTSAAQGGGLNLAASSVTLTNLTVTGNHSTSTNTNMGGGISEFGGPGGMTLINCLVAGNTRGSNVADDLRSNTASGANSKNNLIGDANSAGNLSNGSNGNLVGNGGSGTRPINTILDETLADNGGPTQTHALLLGSPALNAGFNGSFSGNDQRGADFARVQFGTIDIGAIEIQPPTATTLIVDAHGDADDGNLGAGQVSLREAILLANLASNANTIRFASALSGQTITLTNGELRITNPVTITGLGARNLTLSGNNQSRIFTIDEGNDGAFQTVAISDMFLTGGNASGNGGAILNKENLTLTNVAVVNNTASGVGGGVAHDRGSLTVTGSTFLVNTAGSRGGAINANAGSTFQASNSTITGNTAAAQGGGLNLAASGVTLTNLTVIGNRSTTTSTNMGGGIAEFGGPGQMTLVNTIVAANTHGSDFEIDDDLRSNTASTSTSKNNLIGNAASAGGLSNGSNGNLVGNGGSGTRHIDTILNTDLADNGGPTLTHALAANSPAINSGFNVALTTDQTGGTRAVFGFVDIGAIEAPLPTTALIVDSSSDAVDGNFGPGQLTLREAVLIANGRAGADTITFAAALNGQTITLTGGELPVTESLTVAGPGANLLTIDTVGQSRIFKIDDGDNTLAQTVELSGLRLFQGQTTGNGGAILNRENLTLSNVTLESNVAQGAGGGLAHERGILRIAGSLFTGNGAGAGNGGAIDASAGTSLRVSNSTFYNNLAGTHGAGLNVASSDAVLTHVTLAFNHAGGQGSGTGGGLATQGGPGQLTLLNSLVAGNTRSGIVNDLSAGAVSPTASKGNLISDAASASGLSNGVNGNIVGVMGFGARQWTSLVAIEPGDNGGPTLSLALAPDSPALNNGVELREQRLLTPTSVVSSTAGADFFPASQLINNSGLSATPTLANYGSVTHGTASATSAWVTASASPDYYSSNAAPVLTFQLNATYQLTDFVTWGYNINGGPNNNEAKAFALAFSTDGGATFGTPVHVEKTSRNFSGATTLPLGGSFLANAVRVTITDNFFGAAGADGGDRVGLGEVKFLAALGEVGPDQRGAGFARSNRPDIGAFEAQPPLPAGKRSSVAALPVSQDSAVVDLSWSVQPGSVGPISTYNIFMSTDNGAYERILTETSATTTRLQLEYGRTYRFFSIAQDGHFFYDEAAPLVPDATITVVESFPGLDLDPDARILRWTGDDTQADNVSFSASAGFLYMTTKVGRTTTKTKTFNLNDFSEFRLFGRGGADVIGVSSLTGKTVVIEGGPGVDSVTLSNPKMPVQVRDADGQDNVILQGAGGANSFGLSATGVTLNGQTVTINSAAQLELRGNLGNDTLQVQALPNWVTTFSPNFGTDTLSGPNADSSWRLTNSGTGSLTGEGVGTLNFSKVENLTGGAGRDTFKFDVVGTKRGSVTGKIDGGGGDNVLDYSAFTSGVSVKLARGSATNTGGVRNIGVVLGGSGADKLTASATGSVLVGNGGNDKLTGGNGRDILLGGAGADTLSGGLGEDIVMGDPSDTTPDSAYALALWSEWRRTDRDYLERVTSLVEGAPGRPSLTASDDQATDRLTGGPDLDWFFASGFDVVLDRTEGE